MSNFLTRVLLIFIFVLSLEAKPLKIAYQDRVIDALFIVADKKKIFENSGVDVQFQRFSSGVATIEALVFSDVDLATAGDSAALLALSKFHSNIAMLSSLGGGEKRHGIVVLKDAPYQSLEDLQGKKIALKKGTSTHGGFDMKAKQLRIQVDTIDLSPSLMSDALSNKQVDAIVASEPTPTLLEEKGIGRKIGTLEGQNNIYPLILMIKKRSYTQNKEAIKSVVKALGLALDFINDNPKEAISIVSNATGLSFLATQKSMQLHHYGLGWDKNIEHSLHQMTYFLYQTHKIKKMFNPMDYVIR